MAFACWALAMTGTHWDIAYLVKCALFVEQWFEWCPNGPSWFVFALLPSWILYPFTRKVVVAAEAQFGDLGLWALLLGLWALSFGPALVLLVLHGNITMQQHSDMMFWPPSQMADFAIGMTTAAMVRRRSCLQTGGWPIESSALLADISLSVIVGVVFFLPRPPRTWALHLNGWEPLLDHGLALAIAGFLLGSCTEQEDCKPVGLGAKLLGHPALASLGEMSFEVYIFQRPMHDIFALFFDADSPEVFMVYVLTLWVFAGLYVKYVQAPVDRWLRSKTENWDTVGRHGRIVAGAGHVPEEQVPVLYTDDAVE
ncbi:unnamed protein product [Polarella glacialis]|uniref:Uncharacterized protein n=1 Tax=Polarella glacialis TaxID=89957 RepID=A0A813FPJ2_POLGL|nr:unnamed protein product [Polarella glacialis]